VAPDAVVAEAKLAGLEFALEGRGFLRHSSLSVGEDIGDRICRTGFEDGSQVEQHIVHDALDWFRQRVVVFD